MSFPEYLKGRISEEYKNLILQKLQEVKDQVDGLDGVVDSSLSEVNSDLRNSLERQFDDIRQNLDNQLNQAREKISASLKSAMEERNAHWNHSDVSGFQPQMDSLVSDIVVNVPTPPKSENEDLKSLTELSSKLDQAATQSDVLNTLLDHISGWVDRAVLFVIKGNQATGWASVGLGWEVHKVRMIKIELDREHVLSRAVLTGVAAYGPANMYPDNSEVFLLFGEQFPETALAFPILVRGKSAGVLYADMRSDLSEKPDVPNLLFLASRVAGLCIDALPLKKPVPSRETVPVASRSVTSQIAVVDADDTAPHATVTMPLPKAPEVTDEDQKLHDEAKRFARLLVSEIKLYNEAQVSAGREHKDLYDRLKDDIERSRRMYMDRIPTHIHSSTNYFYEELVRTLANGDPTLLGM